MNVITRSENQKEVIHVTELNNMQLLKEVMELEIKAVQRIRDRIDEKFAKVVEEILLCKGKIIFLGVGKSGHIGKKLAATFASTGTPSFFVHATEALHGDLGMIEKDDLVIAISNSGETKEILAPFPSLRFIGCKIIAMTGNSTSTLARESDLILEVYVEKEADPLGLAPTSSSTTALVVGDAIAITVSQLKNFGKQQFGLFHPGGSLGQKLIKDGIIS